jgi:hypothetical protein
MTAISIISALFIIIVIIITINWRQKKSWQLYSTSLPNIILLKSLITLLQKHRGMCASYLQGDQDSLKVIKRLSTKITPLVEQLNNTKMVNQHQRWLGFIDHWQRLKNHAIKLSVEKSFEQHTDLVGNLLYLLEDTAEQQGLTKSTFIHIPHISMLWRELPFTAEYIGQSRALGMAVTTAGIATQVDKVKLGYLETKISQLAKDVFQQIQENSSGKSEQQQFIKLASQACIKFTNIINQELLTEKGVTISANDYFAAATWSMDAIHRLLDSELQELSVFVNHHCKS